MMKTIAANFCKLMNIEGKKIYVKDGKRYMEIFGSLFVWDPEREVYEEV